MLSCVYLFKWCPLLLPVETAAVVAAAPVGHFELLQLSGFGHRVDLGEVGLVEESGSGFVLPAYGRQVLKQTNKIYFYNIVCHLLLSERYLTWI